MNASQIKILLIDDDEIFHDLYKRQLGPLGCDVESVYGCNEALKWLKSHKCNLILVDYEMPEKNGPQTVAAIRSGREYANTPIIMLTSRSEVDFKLEGFRAGIDDYIVKMTDVREIKARIDNLLLSKSKINFLEDLFSRYVSRSVLDQVLSHPESVNLGGQSQEATILFCDIRNFTPLSEELSPENLVYLLNKFFKFMEDGIFFYGGMVNKYIGDSVMAIFGAPVPNETHALDAVRAAIRMQLSLKDFNRQLRKKLGLTIQVGIGLHTGPVVAGNIGTPNRMEYTAIGTTVNIASRIEGLTKEFGQKILLSGATYEQVHDMVKAEVLGEKEVKGVAHPIPIYSLTNVRF